MRIGVFGATGEVGKGVLKVLAQEKYQVTAYYRTPRKAYELKRIYYPKIDFEQIDLQRMESIELACEKCDILINCAGPASEILDRIACVCIQKRKLYVDVAGGRTLRQKIELDYKTYNRGCCVLGAGIYPGLTEVFASAIAKSQAEQIPLRVSWRKNGFFGELYRIGTSELIEWVDPETGEIYQCPPSKKYMECQKLKAAAISEMENKLAEFGYRMKFPMKSGDLSRRWCSAYLKIMVADTVLRNMNSVAANLTKTRKDIKLLIVSGERRGESVGRSKYNEIEIHRTNAVYKHHRTVHQWRPVIDYSERDIWEVLKRHKVNPHPCYRAGWNRCSCAMCIFSTPRLFAGIRELYPKEYALLCQDEKILGFTLDNHCDLETYIGSADSCVYHGDKEAIQSLLTGEFPVESVYVKGKWKYPAGAFHGAAGGPC